jgi:hypothetical protein
MPDAPKQISGVAKSGKLVGTARRFPAENAFKRYSQSIRKKTNGPRGDGNLAGRLPSVNAARKRK